MTNRELLKEAIADAKAVKEVAITNAKAALEEAFTPHLKSMLEQKLSEMEEEDETHMEEVKHEDADSMEEINLEELLRELEDESEEETEEMPDGEVETEEEEEIDFDNMTAEDLEKFIESVVDEMIEAGELEAGHEHAEEETEEEPGEEETVDLGEADEEPIEEPGKIMAEKVEDEKEERETEKMRTLENDLAEALEAIKTLRSELQEVNLLNSKLLYTNKIFKAKNLSEAQKVQVLAAFDNAETVKEAKLVYETLSAGLNKTDKKELVRESKGFASKPVGTSPKQPVVEVNPVFERMRKLAGLK